MINSERLTEKAREALSLAHELAQHDHNSQIEGTNGHEPASDDGVKSQSKSMRYMHGLQPGRAIGKLRAVFALAVAVMGVINDLTVLLPTRPGRLALLGSLLNPLAPFAPSIWPVLDTGRTLALILGFFLLVVAFGLARGKRRAWQFALLLLPLSALAHLAKGLAVEEALLALLLWLGLLRSASLFRVASDPWRLRQGVVLLVLGALLLAIYTVSGLSLLQAQLLLPGTVGGFVRSFLLRLVQSPAGEITPLSRQAAWFLGLLRGWEPPCC